MLSLKTLLTEAVAQASADELYPEVFTTGFYDLGTDEQVTLVSAETHLSVVDGLHNAQFVYFMSATDLARLLDSNTPNRQDFVANCKGLPDSLLRIMRLEDTLSWLDVPLDPPLGLPSFEGPFRMPLRYPVVQNTFLHQQYTPKPIPTYDRDKLPQLVSDSHLHWIELYDYAWQLAFNNLRTVESDSGFASNFIDTAFNTNTFMWDSCFMMMFGRYGSQVFDFMGTLDNFYAKQHADGFICREIHTYTGRDLFDPEFPSSTGPNIMAWTEWLNYLSVGDEGRLQRVFPALVAYHLWYRDMRTHRGGGYWATGWASGMDNQTRVSNSSFHHRHYIWVDTCMQQALNCQMLLNISQVIGNTEFAHTLKEEYAQLAQLINEQLWNSETQYYHDCAPDGTLGTVKSISAYWGLLTDILPTERRQRLLDCLRDERIFNRPHRVPTQAADSEHNVDYFADGHYWLGGVWSPTNYMVLQGLTQQGEHELAHQIALNHVENIAEVFANTGTLWENYAPESAAHGNPAKPNFVGWTGASAIAVPIEYLIGLHMNSRTNQLQWRIHLTDERHGVICYPVSADATADLIYEPDSKTVHVAAQSSFTLCITFDEETKVIEITPGDHTYTVPQ